MGMHLSRKEICDRGLFQVLTNARLKISDQLVTHVTRILAVRLKKPVWSHHHALKAKVQCDFSSAYSPGHTNALTE